MSLRKYVTLDEAIDSLLGKENVCSEQAIIVLPSGQGDGYATNLEQDEVDVNSNLEMLRNDIVGWVEVCGDSPGKEYLASEPSNSVGPSAKKKIRQPTTKVVN